MKATYVSVWNGDTEIRSNCDYDPITYDVTNIKSVDINVGNLHEEFIITEEGSVIKRCDFTIDGENDITYYVDIPRVDGKGSPSVEWYNVKEFTIRKAAIDFAQKHFGADKNGMVSLISES